MRSGVNQAAQLARGTAVQVAARCPATRLLSTITWPACRCAAGDRQLVLDPKTYDLMGQQLILGPSAGAKAGHLLSGTAILKSALVSGPGIAP